MIAHSLTHSESRALAPWFHNLHLPDGSQTAPDHPLGDFPAVKWHQIAPFIAADLTGWRALDIGCNAGFYSFELARRGAHVTAIDIDEHYLRQARWAAQQYGLRSRVDFHRASVYELARHHERYDFVCFLGVLYHLRHPLLALDIVREITIGRMVLQTMTMPDESVTEAPDTVSLDDRLQLTRPGWPHLAFIERAVEGDPTNWWVPNHACVEAMVRAAGFTVVSRPGHEIYLCEPDRREPQVNRQLREAELAAVSRPVDGSGNGENA